MKTRKLILALCALPIFYVLQITNIRAQTDSTAATQPEEVNSPQGGGQKFLLAGSAKAQWQNTAVKGTPSSNTFNPLSVMLMPLVKINNKIFLDAQVEVDPNLGPGGGAAINLNELIIYYRVNPYLNVFFGNFSPKYGLYMGVLDDFTNRFCSTPIGLVRGPQTQTGVGIQGGIQTGYSKINYQLYLANGPQLIVDTTKGSSNQNGLLDYGNYSDNNKNKCIGGSLGWLPFSNSSLQLDVSGQYTPKTGDASTIYENISSTSLAADLNYYHTFSPVLIRVLAEYNSTKTQSFNVYDNSNNIIMPAFNNMLSGWYGGATARLTGVNSQFISSLELGARVGQYAAPTDPLCLWGGKPIEQTTICLTYWFSWKTPLNFAYDIYTQTGSATQKLFTAKATIFF